MLSMSMSNRIVMVVGSAALVVVMACAGEEGPRSVDEVQLPSLCDTSSSPGGGPLCPGGTSCCSGVCSDIDSDPDNCGACGRRCGSKAPDCCSGVCVNLKTD